MLGRVIVTEKQELEAEKVKLMEEVTQYKRKMKELEDNLLYKLTSTQVILILFTLHQHLFSFTIFDSLVTNKLFLETLTLNRDR